MLVMDSGAITRLAKRTRQNAATIAALRRGDLRAVAGHAKPVAIEPT